MFGFVVTNFYTIKLYFRSTAVAVYSGMAIVDRLDETEARCLHRKSLPVKLLAGMLFLDDEDRMK